NHVDPRGIYSDAEGFIVVTGTELSGPDLVAIRVVLAHVGVGIPGAGLSGQGPEGHPGYVDTRGIHGYISAVVPVIVHGAELACPQQIARSVEHEQEGVPVPRTLARLPGQCTSRRPDHVDA